MKALLILSILGLALSGCRKAPQYAGVCVHPFVNGGMPFELDPASSFEWYGSRLYSPDGKGYLVGVQCSFMRIEEAGQ